MSSRCGGAAAGRAKLADDTAIAADDAARRSASCSSDPEGSRPSLLLRADRLPIGYRGLRSAPERRIQPGRIDLVAEHVPIVVIGGGQSGLAMGYHLRRLGEPFVILDAGPDRRRLAPALELVATVQPARYASLQGLPIETTTYPTGPGGGLPGDVREHFQLPIRHRQRSSGSRGRARCSWSRPRTETITADRVVVATGSHGKGRGPAFAVGLDPSIRQVDSAAYAARTRLTGDVLVVGPGRPGPTSRSTLLAAGIRPCSPARIRARCRSASTRRWSAPDADHDVGFPARAHPGNAGRSAACIVGSSAAVLR